MCCVFVHNMVRFLHGALVVYRVGELMRMRKGIIWQLPVVCSSARSSAANGGALCGCLLFSVSFVGFAFFFCFYPKKTLFWYVSSLLVGFPA
jgi:hypothetical protein